MDYYRLLTSILHQIASFTVLDVIASFMTVYLSVTGYRLLFVL